MAQKKEMNGRAARNDDKDETGISPVIFATLANIGAHSMWSLRLGNLMPSSLIKLSNLMGYA